MKAFRDWDLACKINAAILLFLLVAGGLIGGVLYWKTRQILSEEVDTSARAAVRLAAERINRDFPVVEAAARADVCALPQRRSALRSAVGGFGRSEQKNRRAVGKGAVLDDTRFYRQRQNIPIPPCVSVRGDGRLF